MFINIKNSTSTSPIMPYREQHILIRYLDPSSWMKPFKIHATTAAFATASTVYTLRKQRQAHRPHRPIKYFKSFFFSFVRSLVAVAYFIIIIIIIAVLFHHFFFWSETCVCVYDIRALRFSSYFFFFGVVVVVVDVVFLTRCCCYSIDTYNKIKRPRWGDRRHQPATTKKKVNRFGRTAACELRMWSRKNE